MGAGELYTSRSRSDLCQLLFNWIEYDKRTTQPFFDQQNAARTRNLLLSCPCGSEKRRITTSQKDKSEYQVREKIKLVGRSGRGSRWEWKICNLWLMRIQWPHIIAFPRLSNVGVPVPSYYALTGRLTATCHNPSHPAILTISLWDTAPLSD